MNINVNSNNNTGAEAINGYAQNVRNSLNLGNSTRENRTQSAVNAFSNLMVSTANGTNVVSSSDNIKSRINTAMEGINSVEESIMSDAQVAKDNLKALFNKLSGAETVAMDEDGWHINDMDTDEILTVVDRIKIMLATYCDDYQVMSGDVDKELIAEEVGDALASKISQKLSGTYVPNTEDNINEVNQALLMAQDIQGKLSDGAISYLITNNMELSVENVYKAMHSAGQAQAQPLTQQQWEQLMPQINKIIESAGLEINSKNQESAKWLVSHQIELNENNLLKYNELSELEITYDEDAAIDKCVNAIADGKRAVQASVTDGGEPGWKKIGEALDILNKATTEDADNAIKRYGTLTIAGLSYSQTSVEGYFAASAVSVTSSVSVSSSAANGYYSESSVRGYMVMYEARLTLTAYSAGVLVNNGIDIFNEDLKNIVDMLHEMRNKYIVDELSDKNSGTVTPAQADMVTGFTDALNALRYMPAAAIGTVVSTQVSITVESLTSAGGNMQRQYEEAGGAYETMSTQIRKDMGDKLSDAVKESAESILSGLGMENNSKNQRAVRILAANSMDMTEENIYAVKAADEILNHIMEELSPQTVFNMIRDGYNPAQTDIETLESYMEEQQENTGEKAEKFSEFLYNLDKNKEITSEERERFMAVYKMFSMFKKDAGNAIGALVNQGADVTMENLITAIYSEKKSGMDIVLDTDAGMAQVEGKVSYFKSVFAGLEKKITPSLLKNAQKDGTLDDVTLEELANMADSADNDISASAEYYDGELDKLQQMVKQDEQIVQMLTAYDIPVTFNNIMGMHMINNDIEKVIKEMDKKSGASKLYDDIDNIADSLDLQDSVSEAYDKLASDTDDIVRNLLKGDESHKLDLDAVRGLTQAVKLMGVLSDRHDYVIPFVTESGAGTMKLRLISDEENSGTISINIRNNDYQVNLECGIESERIDIYATGDIDNINEDNISTMTQELEQLGYSQADIHILKGESGRERIYGVNKEDRVPTEQLYKTAKQLVKNLMSLYSN